ncbi:hypothetical protein I4F81_001110 [Pyropia yezoensis]|uniref:Uncharacterized protein n=1 Tax=Pyropia yezoensis TaxID=2788 RepID=A0ACC3BKM6_PYRYE|nr:hypothetical protein I4F81_001110 [Neopyropia yezoensis]
MGHWGGRGGEGGRRHPLAAAGQQRQAGRPPWRRGGSGRGLGGRRAQGGPTRRSLVAYRYAPASRGGSGRVGAAVGSPPASRHPPRPSPPPTPPLCPSHALRLVHAWTTAATTTANATKRPPPPPFFFVLLSVADWSCLFLFRGGP